MILVLAEAERNTNNVTENKIQGGSKGSPLFLPQGTRSTQGFIITPCKIFIVIFVLFVVYHE